MIMEKKKEKRQLQHIKTFYCIDYDTSTELDEAVNDFRIAVWQEHGNFSVIHVGCNFITIEYNKMIEL